jgi:hypothetical protein
VASLPLGGLPGGFFGASESPSRSILVKRLTEERLTPNRLAVSRLDASRLTASTIFRLRSSEYAFMLSNDPMRVKVFAHRCKGSAPRNGGYRVQ